MDLHCLRKSVCPNTQSKYYNSNLINSIPASSEISKPLLNNPGPFAFNALNAFNTNKNVRKYDYILRSVYITSIRTEIRRHYFSFLLSSSRPCISHQHMKSPRVTNVQHPTKTHCVWGGVGVRNVINCLFFVVYKLYRPKNEILLRSYNV